MWRVMNNKRNCNSLRAEFTVIWIVSYLRRLSFLFFIFHAKKKGGKITYRVFNQTKHIFKIMLIMFWSVIKFCIKIHWFIHLNLFHFSVERLRRIRLLIFILIWGSSYEIPSLFWRILLIDFQLDKCSNICQR